MIVTGRPRGYVSVDVAMVDALDGISDDELLAEVRSRGLDHALGKLEFRHIENAWEALRSGRFNTCDVILERICRPKWKSLAEAETALAAARRREERAAA